MKKKIYNVEVITKGGYPLFRESYETLGEAEKRFEFAKVLLDSKREDSLNLNEVSYDDEKIRFSIYENCETKSIKSILGGK